MDSEIASPLFNQRQQVFNTRHSEERPSLPPQRPGVAFGLGTGKPPETVAGAGNREILFRQFHYQYEVSLGRSTLVELSR